MNANDLTSLIPLALLLVFAYLVLIRPARRRARDIQSVQTALSPGDEIMLTSGIYGVVSYVGDERLVVQLTAGVEVEVARAAVAKIVRDVPAEQAPPLHPGEAAGSDEPHGVDGSSAHDGDHDRGRDEDGTASGEDRRGAS